MEIVFNLILVKLQQFYCIIIVKENIKIKIKIHISYFYREFKANY